MFIGGALICKYCVIPFEIMISIAIVCNVCLLLYAPADTYKRPLLNAKKRKIYKIITMFSSLIYLLLIIIFKDNDISNYLVLGLLDASLMIHPLTYRMFQLPYDNYKTYEASLS